MRAKIKRPSRRWPTVIAISVVLLALGWAWPPTPYKWICEPSIESAAADAVPTLSTFENYGYPGDRYQISKSRWVNAFRVEVDITYSPGPKAGWGTTLLMELTFAGWRVVGEKNGYVV
jgi:hypothetical protein